MNGGVLLASMVLDQMHLNYLGRSTNLLHDPPAGMSSGEEIRSAARST